MLLGLGHVVTGKPESHPGTLVIETLGAVWEWRAVCVEGLNMRIASWNPGC